MRFPVDVFPSDVKDYILEGERINRFSVNHLSSSFLASASALIGTQVKVKPLNDGSYYESVTLWMVIVADSGSKKSPTLSYMLRPLERLNKKWYAQYQEQLREGGEDEIWSKQVLVRDVTYEALCGVMERNPNGVLMERDEILAFLNDLGRYGQSGALQDLLTIYSGRSISINRKKNNDYRFISDPFVSILGGIQTDLVSELFKDGKEVNGFTFRVLFSLDSEYRPAPIQSSTNNYFYDDYDNLMEGLSKISETKEDEGPFELKLSEEARKVHLNWFNEHFYDVYDDLSTLDKGYLSKLEGTSYRLALILEVVWCVSLQLSIPEFIGEESMRKAIVIIEYYYSNFKDICRRKDYEKKTDELKAIVIKTMLGQRVDRGRSIVQLLLDKGYSNKVISSTLNIPKSTVSKWGRLR